MGAIDREPLALALYLALATATAACAAPAGPGWSLSPSAEAAAAQATVPYSSAPPWDDGASCAGALLPGVAQLGEALQDRFPQIGRVYGYECRPNSAITTELSQHGTGRAVDLGLATVDGEADNVRGDEIASWLVEHSAEIGVQLIIWDRGVWLGTDPTTVKPYGGPDPHVDHLHVELTDAGAHRETPFFGSPGPT